MASSAPWRHPAIRVLHFSQQADANLVGQRQGGQQLLEAGAGHDLLCLLKNRHEGRHVKIIDNQLGNIGRQARECWPAACRFP